jgi:hypothetical protein
MTLDVHADLFHDDLDAVGDALRAAGDPAVVGKMWANGGQSPTRVTSIREK